MVLRHGEYGFDPAAFADIGSLRESILGAHHIFAQPKALPTTSPIRSQSFRLQPIEETQAQFSCRQVMLGPFRIVVEVAEPVVVLRPIHQTDIALDRTFREK